MLNVKKIDEKGRDIFFSVFTCGRRPTGHGVIPVVVVVVVVVVVGGETFFYFESPCCKRGVTPHSEIIVGDEPPCIF